MAESEERQDLWPSRFLDYLGLGFILTGVDMLVRDSAYILGLILILFGGAALAIGLNWESLKSRINPRLYASIEQVSLDARWWIGTSFAFVLFITARDLPASRRDIWLDRAVTAIVVIVIMGAARAIYQRADAYRGRRPLPEGQRGNFDLLVDLERAQKEWPTILNEIMDSAYKLAVLLTKHNLAIRQHSQQPAIPATRWRRVASKIASDFNGISSRIERILPRLKTSTAVFFENQIAVVTLRAANASATTQLRLYVDTFAGLRKTNMKHSDVWKDNYQTAEGFRGMSQDLNLAIDRMSSVVQRIIGITDDIDKGCKTLLDIINAKPSPGTEASSDSE
jgi:hypothetical protein